MNRHEKLLCKLKNNSHLKLLIVSPSYQVHNQNLIDSYISSPAMTHLKTSYFNKEKFTFDTKLITSDDIEEIIKIADNYDCIINLCDGYINNKNKIPNVDFIEALEQNGIPYTGTNQNIYKLSKYDLTGKIKSPITVNYHQLKANNDLVYHLNFPLFVKPNNLSFSELIDENSVVWNKEELMSQLDKVLKVTDDIVIQEYIDGNEYTAFVLRNKDGKIICLDPLHIKINSSVNYLTNKIKINEYTKNKDNDTVVYDLNIDEIIKNNIKKICIDAYEKLNINSYVRMDLRDEYIIDINPYPEILGLNDEINLDTIIINHCYSYDEFLIDILYDATNKKYKIIM
jgi:hypothetical protein